jgi:hypothetical protein
MYVLMMVFLVMYNYGTQNPIHCEKEADLEFSQ